MALWDVVKPCIETVFIVFHSSVVKESSCILNERRQKNPKFSSAFYTLYILQTFFDIMFVLTVRSSKYPSSNKNKKYRSLEQVVIC